jgi:hypothetical protein
MTTVQELTHQLLNSVQDHDPTEAIPALLVTAAKLAAAIVKPGEELRGLGGLLGLLSITFHEERTKRPTVQ